MKNQNEYTFKPLLYAIFFIVVIILSLFPVIKYEKYFATPPRQIFVYFEDQNNSVENQKLCKETFNEYMKENYPLKNPNQYIMKKIVCNKGECYC